MATVKIQQLSTTAIALESEKLGVIVGGRGGGGRATVAAKKNK